MRCSLRSCRPGSFGKLLCTIVTIALIHVTFNVLFPKTLTAVNRYQAQETGVFVDTSRALGGNERTAAEESSSANTSDSQYENNPSKDGTNEKINFEVKDEAKVMGQRGNDTETMPRSTVIPRNLTTEGKIAIDMLDLWKRKYGKFSLTADDNPYLIQIGNLTCLKEGIDIEKTFESMYPTECVCKANWTGHHCSVPSIVSAVNPRKSFILRHRPRRIIQNFLYNGEWEMLSYRLYGTGDLVTAFIVQDAVYTGYGDPKNISLIPFLLKSSLPEHIQRKVIPNVMLTYPSDAAAKGWPYETAMRDHALRYGLPEEIRDVSDDDIFLHTDADEVPSREALLFLKLHDKIPEPFCFNMQKTVFGFFWYSGEWHMHGGATFRMMKDVYHLKPNLLRRKRHIPENKNLLHAYVTNTGAEIGPLMIGNAQYPSGFHCTWCGFPEAIRTKLLSAINADFPRWGDYPMKCDISYIQSLIAKGQWFDGNKCFKHRDQSQEHYAPDYMLRNSAIFSHLLHNPYNQTKCEEKKTNNYGLLLKNWHRMTKAQFLHQMNHSHISPVPENLLDVLKP